MDKNSILAPEYLIAISQQVQILNKFYETQKSESITPQYKKHLSKSFANLYENINIYSDTQMKSINNASMIKASICRCRAELQLFSLKKLGELLKDQSEEIGLILQNICNMYASNVQEFETAILCERRQRLQYIETQKDNIIERLKDQLINKKDYIEELKGSIHELEKQNSKIYQKMIKNAKVTGDRALSVSPSKQRVTSPNAKIRAQILPIQNTSHKTLSSKQVEEAIFDIMESKNKLETHKGKKMNMDSYLKVYFRNKFGMKGLAEETELNFRQALEHFGETQQKNIFLIFIKIISEECDEDFFWEQKKIGEKVIKDIKKYLNIKEGIMADELDKMYDSKIIDERTDLQLTEKNVQYILQSFYKTTQVSSLQMILNQLMIPRVQLEEANQQNSLITNNRHRFNPDPKTQLIPSKKLINEILNYQLKRHLLKIEDIVYFIHTNDSGRGMMNIEELQAAIIELGIPQEKIEANLEFINSFSNKFLTYSQFIGVIEKIRKTKLRKKNM